MTGAKLVAKVEGVNVRNEAADLVLAQKEEFRPISDVQRNQWPKTLTVYQSFDKEKEI
jgi:hypothetical protein